MYKSYNLIIGLILTLFQPGLAIAANNPLRDPTQPQSYRNILTNQSNNEIKIDAIFSGKNHKIVIIENNLFTIGDKILDSTITAIGSHSIKLKNGHSEFEIIMPYSTVKSPTTKRKSDRENLE